MEPVKKAASTVKDAVSSVTDSIAQSTISGESSGGPAAAGDSKLLKDEETGEMISKTERKFLMLLLSW
jgi:hypothetical protein